jgi:hypothetical protein
MHVRFADAGSLALAGWAGSLCSAAFVPPEGGFFTCEHGLAVMPADRRSTIAEQRRPYCPKSHGRAWSGSSVTAVPEHLATYALNLTATTIRMIGDAEKALQGS